MGLVFFKEKSYSQALVFFKKMQEGLLTKESLLLQAKCYVKLGKIHIALDILNKALVGQASHQGEVFFFLARLCKKNKEYLKSLLLFNKATQLGIKKLSCQKHILECQKHIQRTKS